jgi:hypothetical protein
LTILTGKPLLPTNAFTDAGIDECKIETVKETHFRPAYTKVVEFNDLNWDSMEETWI